MIDITGTGTYEVLSKKQLRDRSEAESKAKAHTFMGDVRPEKPDSRERLREALGIVREKVPIYAKKAQGAVHYVRQGARTIQSQTRGFDSNPFFSDSPRRIKKKRKSSGFDMSMPDISF